MSACDKIKSKHDLLMMYPSYKKSIALCKGTYKHYNWCEIDNQVYQLHYQAEPALKRVGYYPDMNSLYDAFSKSTNHKGIVIPKVPNTIAGGYEVGASSYEADIAKITGYYDVASRVKMDTVNGISYFKGCPLIGPTIDVQYLSDVDNITDVAVSEFVSVLDTTAPNGQIVNQELETKRGGRFYQTIFMLAYNGCKDICVMPGSVPYDISSMTYGQAYIYALGLSHCVNLLAGIVDNWYIYIGNIDGNIFAQAMYQELSSSNDSAIVGVN